MSKASDLREAAAEAESTNAWKCETCSAPAIEGEKHCLSCKLYWQDCANGLFDDDSPFICPLSNEQCIRAFCEDYGCADQARVPLDDNDFAAGTIDPTELMPALPFTAKERAKIKRRGA